MSDFLSPVSATATSRRRYPVEYKRQVVQESMLSGASIARTAMAHGINANQLHNWRWQYRRGDFEVATQEPILLPVQIQVAQALHKSPAQAVSGQDDDTAGDIELIFSAARVVIRGAPDQATLRCVIDALRP